MDGTSTSTVVVGLDLDLPTATTDGVEVVSPQDLTGTATDALSGVAMLLVQWNGGAPSTSYTMRAELACDSTRRSCVWSAASPPIGSYTVTLQVTDVADLTSDVVIGAVTVAEPI
jgi:hypothetical protein